MDAGSKDIYSMLCELYIYNSSGDVAENDIKFHFYNNQDVGKLLDASRCWEYGVKLIVMILIVVKLTEPE